MRRKLLFLFGGFVVLLILFLLFDIQIARKASTVALLVTPSFVRAAHTRGVQVHVWTINHPPTMKKLLSMGVDGIMTDLPQRLFRVRQPFLKNKQHHKTNAPSSIPTTRP